ncbi:MAG: zinc finger domain-containing protein, partial [Candidatus Nitrosopelagicus sp.]|nr:zinc finger domain-containing protein [Candidatus Nitrosopelagicus sp.]
MSSRNILDSNSPSISLPVCSGCNKHIMPGDKNVKFNCPECNNELIWRCGSC